MQIDDLIKLGKQARIKLTKEEATSYAPQMDTIIESVKILGTIDTGSKEEYLPHLVKLDELREDIVMEGLSREEALSNAPFTDGKYVLVYGDITESEEA